MTRTESALKYFLLHEDYTKERVKSGIEQYRKAPVRVRVRSKEALPENLTLELHQLTHEFGFGANLFMLDEFESDEKNALYRSKFPEILNLATLPFYWDAQEPEPRKYRFDRDSSPMYRRPNAELCLDYCAEKGIEPKAHCLNYDHMRPKWLADVDTPTYKRELENRFEVLAERFADRIPSWEVTNETFNLTFARDFLEDNYYSRFYRERDFNKWSFETADRYFRTNKLIINDHLDFGCMRSLHGEFFGERSPYFAEIDRLTREGVSHLDSVGFQFHCFFPKAREAELAVTRYNPEHIFDVLDTYERLGKKLQITEMTLSAFSYDAEDEEVQGELTRRLYEIFFSHPAMEAIIYWNLVDGYAAGARVGDMARGENVYHGGLLRHDFTEKPAYKALKRLISTDWRTDVTLPLREGEARTRAFCGRCKAILHVGERTLERELSVSNERNNFVEFTL